MHGAVSVGRVVLKCMPNHKRLGDRFGKAYKGIQGKIRALDTDALDEALSLAREGVDGVGERRKVWLSSATLVVLPPVLISHWLEHAEDPSRGVSDPSASGGAGSTSLGPNIAGRRSGFSRSNALAPSPARPSSSAVFFTFRFPARRPGWSGASHARIVLSQPALAYCDFPFTRTMDLIWST